jgi:hypothetical protein
MTSSDSVLHPSAKHDLQRPYSALDTATNHKGERPNFTTRNRNSKVFGDYPMQEGAQIDPENSLLERRHSSNIPATGLSNRGISPVAKGRENNRSTSPGSKNKQPDYVSKIPTSATKPLLDSQQSFSAPTAAATTIASPSPPRTLADAYAKVAADEIASVDSSGSRIPRPSPLSAPTGRTKSNGSGDWTTYHYTYADRSRDQDRIRLDRMRSANSPAFSKGSHRSASPEGTKKASGSEDGDTVASGLTGLTLSDTDDSFARKLQEHDQSTPRKSSPVAFKKANVGQMVNATMYAMENERLGREAEDDATDTLIPATPAVRVPRQWGRKARRQDHWLGGIRDGVSLPEGLTASGSTSNGYLTETDAGSESRPEMKRSHSGSGAVADWLNSADDPIPSIEDNQTNRQYEGEKNSDDDSFIPKFSSTPKPNHTKLDQIRQREINALKEQQVATNRIGDIKKKESEEDMRTVGKLPLDKSKFEGQDRDQPQLVTRKASFQRPRLTSMDEGTEFGTGFGSPVATSPSSGQSQAEKTGKTEEEVKLESDRRSSLSRSGSASRLARMASMNRIRESTPKPALEEEGEAIPDTPVRVYRAEDIPKVFEGTSLGRNVDRTDKLDMLRKLARATSGSPSPQLIRSKTYGGKESPKGSSSSPTKESATESPESAGAQHYPTPEFDTPSGRRQNRSPTRNHSRSRSRSRARNTIPLDRELVENVVDPAPDINLQLATPQPKESTARFTTPFFPGAYLETPATTRSKIPFDFDDMESVGTSNKGGTSEAGDLGDASKRPSPPNFSNPPSSVGTGEFTEDINVDENLEDATLDAFLNDKHLDTLLIVDSKTRSLAEDDSPPEVTFRDVNGKRLTKAEEARVLESIMMERMAKRVRRLQHDVTESKEGIEGLLNAESKTKEELHDAHSCDSCKKKHEEEALSKVAWNEFNAWVPQWLTLERWARLSWWGLLWRAFILYSLLEIIVM